MANISLLVPDDELFRLAHDALQEMKKRLFMMKVIETESAVSEARQAINQGTDIIIARGLQATIIKQYTDIPVVEIIMTRQGLINMIERAKRIIGKENPNIAIVMFKNMTCDMTGIGEACHVQLKEYLVQNPELLRAAALQAVEDKADLIMGGKTVLTIADNAGIPALFMANTEDAVKHAIKEAFLLADTFENSEIPAHAVLDKGKSSGKHKEQFVNFPYKSEKMQAAVDLAEMLSKTDCPKLILEPIGNLHKAFVNAMHNHSKHSQEKLVSYECIKGQSSYDDLYGRQGKVNDSIRGTLVIDNFQYMDVRSQKKLLEILMFRNVILVAKTRNLKAYLIPELYARLSAFAIKVPTLMETAEDIPYLTNIYMQNCTERYGMYHVMTKDAEKKLQSFYWPGGRIQLESFIERLVITSDHRSLKVTDVCELYEELYGGDIGTTANAESGKISDTDYGPRAVPDFNRGISSEEDMPFRLSSENMMETEDIPLSFSNGQKEAASKKQTITVGDLEKNRLIKSLSDNMGNREKTAAELGISKTTLWRKLRKYGLV